MSDIQKIKWLGKPDNAMVKALADMGYDLDLRLVKIVEFQSFDNLNITPIEDVFIGSSAPNGQTITIQKGVRYYQFDDGRPEIMYRRQHFSIVEDANYVIEEVAKNYNISAYLYKYGYTLWSRHINEYGYIPNKTVERFVNNMRRHRDIALILYHQRCHFLFGNYCFEQLLKGDYFDVFENLIQDSLKDREFDDDYTRKLNQFRQTYLPLYIVEKARRNKSTLTAQEAA